MGWARMDDSRADHPKLLAAGLAARGLDEACIEWCARHETDGTIPSAAVAMLAAGHGTTSWKPLARRLVEVGRWEVFEGGYVIHDYLKYNPTAADLTAKREATAERVKRHRNSVTNSVTNATVTPLVTPVPTRPDPLLVTTTTTLKPVEADPAVVVVDAALRILAERLLAQRQAAIGPVANREAWLAGTVTKLRERHVEAIAAFPGSHTTLTPSELAELLEPPHVELPSIYAFEKPFCPPSPDGCGGSGMVETVDGCVPCAKCNGAS